MQKAFAWLDARGLSYEFHDYKKLGITDSTLQLWCSQLGWQVLLNTRGTTWRKLSDDDRHAVDETKAIRLMQANPSLIKRPVITGGRQIVVGFDEARLSTALESQK